MEISSSLVHYYNNFKMHFCKQCNFWRHFSCTLAYRLLSQLWKEKKKIFPFPNTKTRLTGLRSFWGISGDFCFPSTIQLLSNPNAKVLIFARNKAHLFIKIPLRIYLSMFSRKSFKMLSRKQDKLKRKIWPGKIAMTFSQIPQCIWLVLLSHSGYETCQHSCWVVPCISRKLAYNKWGQLVTT